MDNKLDTYYLKIQGKVNIPEMLNMGENYEVRTQGTITQARHDDNFDGTHSVTLKFEPITIEIIRPMGTAIRAKDPRKNSQKLRSYLFKLYADEGIVEPFDEVYDAVTLEILSLMPQLLRSGLKRLEK